MGRIKKLNQDVRQLANKILEDKELCRLMYYTDSNPLSPDKPEVNGRLELMDKRLLLFRPKLPLAEETGTYVNLLPSQMQPSKGEHYIRTLLVFKIYCHEEIRDVYYYDKNGNDQKGDRALLILDRIMKMMDGVDFSIGKPNIGTIDWIANNDATFSGYAFAYHDVDFRN